MGGRSGYLRVAEAIELVNATFERSGLHPPAIISVDGDTIVRLMCMPEIREQRAVTLNADPWPHVRIKGVRVELDRSPFLRRKEAAYG